MGSIAGPPFPDITGMDQAMITQQLADLGTEYQNTKEDFDIAYEKIETNRQELYDARAALQQAQDNLATVLADPHSTQEMIQEAQQAVTDAESSYETAFANFKEGIDYFHTESNGVVYAANSLFNTTVDYVSAMARQQMFTAQESDQAIATLVSQLSSTLGSPNANTPSWMLSVVAAATPDASEVERQAIIDAFNQYRLLEYNISYARKQFMESYIAHLNNYYDWAATSGPGELYSFESDTSWVNACNYQSQIAALISERPAASSTLDHAVQNLGDPLLKALNYLRSGATLTEHLMAFFTEDYVAKQKADEDARKIQTDTYPTENPEYVQQITGPFIAELEAAKGALAIPTGVDFPVLPPATTNMSMKDLLSIVSKVQIMIQQLSRYIREMDNRLGSIWTASLLLEYQIEQTRAAATDQWISIVQEADKEYNATVNEENATTLDSTISSLQFLVDNSSSIQNIITDANSQITAWNTLISGTDQTSTDFITACNNVSSEIVGAINDARSTYDEAPTYLDIFDFDLANLPFPTIVAPTFFEDLTGYPLPSAALDTATITSLITSLTNLPSTYTYNAEINSLVLPQLNDILQTVVTDLAPVLDRIQALVSPHQQLDLTKLYLREEVPPRAFQAYQPQFFLQFVQNILDQIQKANIEERERADLNKILAGLITVIRTRAKDLQRQQVAKAGVGFGLEAASIEQYPPGIGHTISKLAQSETLARNLYGTLESAAMLAGLSAAGETIKGLDSLMGISVAELFEELGINLNTFVEQQSTQALLLAFSEQLALAAAQPSSLKQTAVNILSQIPGTATLNPDQVKEILAALLLFLQFLLMFMSMLMAALAGMGGAEFLTRIVGNIGGPPQQMLTVLQTLGLPQEKAIALGVALGGKTTELQKILSSMGLDQTASTILLALIGAQIGKVSLTQGVIGGPAFLDALLKKLASSYGITLTEQIGTDPFMKQLLDALQAKATSDQFGALQDEIKRMEQAAAGIKGEELTLEGITNELIDSVIADLEEAARVAAEAAKAAPPPIAPEVPIAPPVAPIAPPIPRAAPPVTPIAPPIQPVAVAPIAPPVPPFAPPVAPIAPPIQPVAVAPIAPPIQPVAPPVVPIAPPILPVAPPAILPSDILAQYVSEFRKLPEPVRVELTSLAQTQLTSIQGLTDEQKAALLIGVRLERTSLTEATLLAVLARAQTDGLLQYNDTVSRTISRLFQEAPEAKQARADALKRAIVNEEIRAKELLPNALPQRIVDDISSSFQSVINNFDDKNFALKTVDSFAKFVEKLSTLSKVEVMLLDPGKILLRLFSVLLTTSQDRLRQPPTLFGG